ncbi:hypothetical protein FRC01_006938, partial [Tulasnella sp. 417]
PDKYIILSSSTLQSTQHKGNRANQEEESVVEDSEIERLSRLVGIPENETFRMPDETDAGAKSPMPALVADDDEIMSTARAMFAPELFSANDFDDDSLKANGAPNLAKAPATKSEHVTNDIAVRLNTLTEKDPQAKMDQEGIRWHGTLANESLNSLLAHEAQPREDDAMELSNSEGNRDISLKEMLDREFAEREQARLYNEAAAKAKSGNGKKSTKGNTKAKKKKTSKKKRSKSHLDLTQWIETPLPTPGSKAPEPSPIRALRQLPSGGYLAQEWTKTNDGKKPINTRMSKHTKDRMKRKRDQLRDWHEGSDLSDSEMKEELPKGRPPSYEPSSPDSSNSGSSSSSDNLTAMEGSDTTIGTSDSESSDDEAHTQSHSAYNQSLKSRDKRRNVLAKTIKYPEPSSYDGRAHLETFETFVFEFKNWIKVNCLPPKYQIIAMKRFLTEKAGAHYMTFAAVNLRKWTVDNYLRALFNYCFPIHFRSQMRSKFNRCVQGGRTM